MGARRLTLWRHGQAQSIDSCAEDFERTLTQRGIAEARKMAERLVHRNLEPDLILCSPAERAWATAQILAKACDMDEKQIQGARELYLATKETTWTLLTRCDARFEHVLICGHNPGLSELAWRFGPSRQERVLPTAGLITAIFQADDWSTLQPEMAQECEQDDPENMTDIWT